MANRMKRSFWGVLILLFLFSAIGPAQAQKSETIQGGPGLTQSRIQQIEGFVNREMRSGKIPGLVLVIVKGDGVVYRKGFGYANLETKTPVTPDTFFEIGSNSKAFTALGVLRLRDQGLLKLSDPVQKHLPWLYMTYHGRKAAITIEQLLHQTSGVPATSIAAIPVSEAPSALEDTVKTLVGKKLEHAPGESFLYATINYDVLGLIIQQVSGQPFERFMKEQVLQPLGLAHTFLFREEASNQGVMSAGYKTGFMQALPYNAPRYRGNTPAGYFITNGQDLGEWLKIQLGITTNPTFNRLILEAQTPDYSVRPSGDGSFYGMGWQVVQEKGKTVSHGGANPNFSSYIILKPAPRIGVALLTNLGNIESGNAQYICQGVMDLTRGIKPAAPPKNTGQTIDSMSTIVVWVAAILILISLGLIVVILAQLLGKKRSFQGKGLKGFSELIILMGLVGLTGYCLYLIPDVLGQGYHWDFVSVWGPISLVYGTLFAFSGTLIFLGYFFLSSYFPKPDEKPYFSLAILSIVSGLGNAFVIFTINAALGADRKHFATTLFLYFILAIIIYVFGSRLVRKRMITITNDIVYFKRITLINQILKASYQKLEALEGGKIHAGLNNDTEVVSNFANILIGGLTSFITLVCCFIYLGILNIYGLLVSIVVIGIAAGLHFYVGRVANKLWEQTRDIQNQFFRFIHDLVSGFKELYLNEQKRDDFAGDMRTTCQTYREKRVEGEFKFINVFVVGELLFTFVIATVGFVFPHLFPEMNINDLRLYIFIFLYMTGPVHGVLGLIPGIIQFRISWKRINQLLEEIALIELTPKSEEFVPGNSKNQRMVIQLAGVTFQYQSETGEKFTVGPIDTEFTTGETTFITGGNGSGKSTLAKLISGLYLPMQGEIKINGNPVSARNLSQYYSAVFSDFYLFQKLYGIQYHSKQELIESYLKLLKIDDKVRLNNGSFDTIKLSTGQKKRLALLICYLEDRPVYLFDEWAADQDAEFRKYFYQVLLPQLRERGKCVIVISHDDRYFHLADRLLKMEMGTVVEQRRNNPEMNFETA